MQNHSLYLQPTAQPSLLVILTSASDLPPRQLPSGFYVGKNGQFAHQLALSTPSSSFAQLVQRGVDNVYRVYADGTVNIGGAIDPGTPANHNPNITLNADGSATFAETISSKRLNVTASTSILSGYNSSGNRLLFIDSEGTLQISGDLSGTAANNVPNISLNADGSAEFCTARVAIDSSASTENGNTGEFNNRIRFARLKW